MTELTIRRADGKWEVLLDGNDVTAGLHSFTLETIPDQPRHPPRLTLHYLPSRLDVAAEEVEVVEVPHEHRWIDVTGFEEIAKQERHYTCNGCPAKRTVRDVIESGDAS